MNNEDLEKIIKNAIQQANSSTSIQTISLSSWLVTYRQILSKRTYSTSTIKNRNSNLKHIEAALGNKAISHIKPFEISNILVNFSAHSAERILGELRDIYYEAVANGICDTNPATHIKPPKQFRIRKRLTIDIWHQMLEKAFDHSISWLAPMLLLALATGQRRGDLVKLKFDDIVDNCLRVEQQKKAGKPIGARLAIPLNLSLNAIGFSLGEIIDFCKIGNYGDTLLRKKNGDSLEVSSLSSRFHELIVSVLGVDAFKQYEWPSLHEVRSLSARTYLCEGLSSPTLQTLLGHKNEEMTKVYLDDRGLSEKEWKVVNI